MPAFLLKRLLNAAGVMLAVAVVLFTFVVPTLTKIFSELAVDLPFTTRAVIWLSDAMQAHVAIVLASLVAVPVALGIGQARPDLGDFLARHLANLDVARRVDQLLRLVDVPADALAQWLALARLNARSTPLEARLLRTNSSGSATWRRAATGATPRSTSR